MTSHNEKDSSAVRPAPSVITVFVLGCLSLTTGVLAYRFILNRQPVNHMDMGVIAGPAVLGSLALFMGREIARHPDFIPGASKAVAIAGVVLAAAGILVGMASIEFFG